jgi:hypothetical protein
VAGFPPSGKPAATALCTDRRRRVDPGGASLCIPDLPLRFCRLPPFCCARSPARAPNSHRSLRIRDPPPGRRPALLSPGRRQENVGRICLFDILPHRCSQRATVRAFPGAPPMPKDSHTFVGSPFVVPSAAWPQASPRRCARTLAFLLCPVSRPGTQFSPLASDPRSDAWPQASLAFSRSPTGRCRSDLPIRHPSPPVRPADDSPRLPGSTAYAQRPPYVCWFPIRCPIHRLAAGQLSPTPAPGRRHENVGRISISDNPPFPACVDLLELTVHQIVGT